MGADDVPSSEGHAEVLQRPGTEVPPGSKSRACMQWDSLGTWESSSFLSKSAAEQRTRTLQALDGASTSKGAKEPHDSNRQRKATKRSGNDEQSESLIVPMKPGNSPTRTRWREGAAYLQNHEEET